MKTQTGFIRFGLAVGVPYFAVWGLVLWFSSRGSDEYYKKASEALNNNELKSFKIWSDAAHNATEVTNQAILWVAVFPVLVLVTLALGYWIYRGFFPRKKADQFQELSLKEILDPGQKTVSTLSEDGLARAIAEVGHNPKFKQLAVTEQGLRQAKQILEMQWQGPAGIAVAIAGLSLIISIIALAI